MANTLIYDRDRMMLDMAEKGWLPTDLARKTKLSDQTVSQFLKGNNNSPRTAKKLATALGYSVRRYLSSRKVVAA